MPGSIREPQQIERRRTARVLKTNCRQFPAVNLASPTAKGHVLEAKPNQTGQGKQKESPLARKRHPQTAARAPANSNRETKSVTRPPANSNRETKSFARTQQRGQRAPANRAQIRQTRRKREADPSFMFRLKGGPTVCFLELTHDFNRTMFRLNQAECVKDLRSAGVQSQTGWALNRRPNGRTPKAKAGGS